MAVEDEIGIGNVEAVEMAVLERVHPAAIGSDLDGGYGTEQTPGDLDTIAALQKLDGLLRDKGYSTEDVEGIFHNNWLRFFREVWS